jgi:hypothetical protein
VNPASFQVDQALIQALKSGIKKADAAEARGS